MTTVDGTVTTDELGKAIIVDVTMVTITTDGTDDGTFVH